jgi:hypothetical protein
MKVGPLYRTFSLYRTIKDVVFRLLSLAVAVYALFHFQENPIAVGVIAIAGVLIFLTAGDDELLIYPDGIQVRGTILQRLLRRARLHRYADIQLIEVDGSFDRKADLLDDLAQIGRHADGKNTVLILHTDGTRVKHELTIYRRLIDEAMDHVPDRFQRLISLA